jgi:hypothetical protein
MNKEKVEKLLKCFNPNPHIFGEKSICPRCKKSHLVHLGFETKSGKGKSLAFVVCKNNRSYLVAINNKII